MKLDGMIKGNLQHQRCRDKETKRDTDEIKKKNEETERNVWIEAELHDSQILTV